MDIVLLDFYLRLFAIIANLFPNVLLENFKDFLKISILKDLNPGLKLEGIKLFNEYYKQYEGASLAGNIQDLRSTVSQVDELIPGKQKFQILLRLLLFEKLFLKYSSASQMISFSDITDFITQDLNIDSSEYNDCRGFISGKYYQINDLKNLLIVSDNFSFPADFPFLQRKNFKGQLIFLYIRKYNIILFTYKGLHYITYNNQPVFASSVYFFNKGTSLNGEGFETIYYNQVYRKFRIHKSIDLKMEVRDLEFRYSNSNHGIHRLNADLQGEQLIGIIGRSGVGKSTLINLLIGSRKPTVGKITINGVGLNMDNAALDGLIGYVSQDDLLVEELSVFMNLFLNARLCFGDLSKELLIEKVNNLLTDLDLYEVKDMQVGSALNRLISGGQRKKLNIALELIREPWILFADEPTSGLSSSDSEEIMQLFSEQTSKGKIVVVNIHQPSSDIFKLFDKIIVLDREGYPVYFGSPLEAIAYFYDYYQMVSVNADICNVCENVNPESIFRILEDKKINQFGEFTKERKTSPEEWHRYFLSKNKVNPDQQPAKDLPRIQFNKPGRVKQFVIFGTRNLLTKLSNYQYILLSLLIAPALAVILAMLCRYNDINESASVYSFAFNENIPSYLFMSVIVALFLGLIMSAEEIIKDRKIVMRESYLKLNKLSYINSKTAFIFGVSAFQLFLYVVIGNAILGIKGMNFSFWLILFSVSCFANLVGLLISSVLDSVIAIYILVPLIIVPQMLLSGVVVNYDKINKYVSSREYVPFVGDIMASRWAYEALMVKQYSSNAFQKYYFLLEQQESNVKFNLLFAVPEIRKSLENLKENKKSEKINDDAKFIASEIRKLNKQPGMQKIFIRLNDLDAMITQMDRLKDVLSDRLEEITQRKDSITQSLIRKFQGTDNYLAYKNCFYNNNLAEIVLKRKDLEPYAIVNNKIVRQFEPVYQLPGSDYGRAHFLSASKNIGKYTLNTFTFNLIALWIMSAAMYGLLCRVSLKSSSKPAHKFHLFKKNTQ